MKKAFFTFLLILISQFSSAATSYWVYYESVTCYIPPTYWGSGGDWGGGGEDFGSEEKEVEVEITYPLDFIIMEDSSIQLTHCINCTLHSSKALLEIYDYKMIGDSILEFSTKQNIGLPYTYINTVFQYKKINPSINLELASLLKNNPHIFRNNKSILLENINLLDLPDSIIGKQLFYRLERDTGNMYNVYVEDKKGSRYIFDILFYLIDEKLYYETISFTPSHECGDCTVEEARKEIQLVTRNKWKLLEN